MSLFHWAQVLSITQGWEDILLMVMCYGAVPMWTTVPCKCVLMLLCYGIGQWYCAHVDNCIVLMVLCYGIMVWYCAHVDNGIVLMV